MKIECDKCGAKYSIADEKVRGKTFKIRCKKCSNVIIVRDKVAAVAAGGGGPEDEPEAAQPGWHLAINGETVGPMSEAEVRERYHAGEIDKDTAVWQEGFDDWVPLGDVETFADLPDRAPAAAAPAEDPFASANHDDYAASAVAAAGAGATAMAAASQPEPRSPRVSSLTGQRNENSVLFSLDSLQSLATGGGSKSGGGGGGARAGSGTRGLATAAPASEGSGLIDIRALGAMVGEEPQRAAGGGGSSSAADDAVLPSFGGAGLGGLASTPLVPQVSPIEAAAAAVAAPPPARSNAPLYAMMGILILAVLGLGAYVVLKDDTPVIVTQETTPAPSVKAASDKDDEDDDKDKKQKKDEDEEDEGDKEEGGDEEDDAAVAEDGEGGAEKATSGSKKNRPRKGTSGSTKPSTSSDAGSQPDKPDKPKTEPKSGPADTSVECILDPKKCKGGSSGSSSKTDKPSGATDPNLPEKLSQTDIKNGMSGVLAAAKACGPKHGAKPGETVKVRISISGATGTVSSATAQEQHQATPLGNCVAAAVKKAQFKKFRSPSMGAIYPVRM